MMRLMVLFSAVVVLSCGGGEKKDAAPGPATQTSANAQEQKAMKTLEAVLVENNGLVIDSVRVDADSIHGSFSLSDEAVETWLRTEDALGRPPVLVWVTVSARIFRGDELQGTRSLRFSQVRQLSPAVRSVAVSTARRPLRGSGHQEDLPEEGEAQCSVLAVHLQ